MSKNEAMKLSLEALKKLLPLVHDENNWYSATVDLGYAAIKALEEALSKQEQVIQTYSEKHNFQQEQGDPDLLKCDIAPRPLQYSLHDYHIAMSEGPLHYTWTDKPHRLVYDLIAAVKYYAKQEQRNVSEHSGEPVGWYIDGYGAVIGKDEPKSVRVGEWLPWYTKPQPKQEQDVPVAVIRSVEGCGDKAVRIKWLGGFAQIGKKLYTTPPQSEARGLSQQRKPLTREVIDRDFHGRIDFVRQVEAAHGIGVNK